MPSNRQSVSLPFLFPVYDKPGIRLSHRFLESPLGILLDDPHFEKVDSHTARLVCPDTSYRYDKPTCYVTSYITCGFIVKVKFHTAPRRRKDLFM